MRPSEEGRGLDRYLGYLGLERNVLVMTLSRSLTSFGALLWTGYLAKVLHSLGASGAAIGALGTIGALVSILFSYLGGGLSDRLGRGRALIVATSMALAGYAIYAAAPVWWVFIPGGMLLSASAQTEFMGSLALVGEVVRDNRRAVSIASQRIIGYLPALISPPLGGLLMARLGVVAGFRVGVAITIVLTLASIAFQKARYRLPPPAVRRFSLDFRGAWASMPSELRWLLLSNGLVFFGSHISTMFAVLYVMDTLGLDSVRYGLLQSLEVALLIVLIVPFGKLSDSLGTRGRRLFTAGSFLFNAAFSLGIALTRSFSGLIPLFLLPGLRESFEPSRKALIIELAGTREPGKVIGFYYLLVGVITFPSSILAGLLWESNPRAPFLVGGAVSAIGLAVHVVGTIRGRQTR